MAKTIAVFGATGQQGGAVAMAMLKNKQYVIRAITRNPDSEKGIRLKEQGEVKVKHDDKVNVHKVKIKHQIPIGFFMMHVSVRLFDRSLHKKKIVKSCPQWGWNPGPPDHHSNALPTEPSQHSVAILNLHGLKVML